MNIKATGPVYLAGPMTPAVGRTLERNIAQAADAMRRLTLLGVAIVCPQLTAARGELADVPYETWMLVDFKLIESCRAVLALPAWDTSCGARRELAHANDHGVPVYFTEAQLLAFLEVKAPTLAAPKP